MGIDVKKLKVGDWLQGQDELHGRVVAVEEDAGVHVLIFLREAVAVGLHLSPSELAATNFFTLFERCEKCGLTHPQVSPFIDNDGQERRVCANCKLLIYLGRPDVAERLKHNIEQALRLVGAALDRKRGQA